MTNHLVCVLSKNATKPADVPIELCTHLVYQELDMDRKTRTFHPRFLHSSGERPHILYRRFVTAKFVVALSGQLIHEATQAAQKDPGALVQIASDLASWLSKNELNGIAFTEQPLVNPSIGHVISMIKAFQAALEALGAPKPALIYGGYLIPKQNSDRSSIKLIKKLVMLVDIFVLETHYHEEEQFCKLVYPSIYVGEGEPLPSLPIKTALFWMEMVREEDDLSSTSKMCFSLSLVTLSFDLTENARPTAGSWCTGRHWINYGDVNRAMEVLHGVCVAAYNVDQDDNEAHCDGVTRFPRLQAIRDVQKNHVDREFYGVKRKKASAVLICIVGELTSEQDRYPTDHCTHIIYKDMVFFGEHKSFRPKEKEHGFRAFKQLGAQSKAQLLIALDPQEVADFYMPLWRNPKKLGHFTRSAAEWLNTYGFDGIAILDQNAPSIADVKRFLPVVKRIFDEFDRQDRKLSIVLGLNLEEHTNTPENVAEAFEDIATYVDYLIIQTHHMRSTPCNVSLTSAFLEHEALSSTVPVRTAISWMRILHVENETNVKLCFSLNMATVTFKTKDSGDGAVCKSERWSNYRDSCLTAEGFKDPVKVQGSLSLYRSSKNSWQTFENEDTVREKVERAVTLYPGVCVAAFYVEHEDSTGTCAPRFSRIAEISKALKRAAALVSGGKLFL
ncbi:hypothetical protein IscW_ISCW001749 [Ixodes scapularis]|uniref:GH18 domain-containing protein n=1 Tax=Ixodes scapularis TaxID=6945 RepID=B7P1B6_IXOSC|nr:hypothetical protein IscW_ISCW001749 [Ixodes scapularis]|eukprot:XP_002433324.1 hypothetical protein IscW_ISCW001749 [Ixodes scapularis]